MAATDRKPWHAQAPEEVLAALATGPGGLSHREARRRLESVGPNLLREAPQAPWWAILLAQFQDFMVLILLVATGVSYALGERADALTIVAIVVLNALLGFVQEYRAERSLAALKELAAPTARVRREGRVQEVPAAEVVPGDVLLLEAGDRVPADARLLEAHSLLAEEAALTGESVPVAKAATWVGAPDTPLGDRRNMVYLGTVLRGGRGEAVAVATGMATEVGRIAGMIQEAEEEPTPLQRRLDQLGRWLVLACLGICALVVVAGTLRGEPATRMFLTGVSLAVAAIPEGLPAIVTVALALGVQRMIRRNAIVRRLQAVETLGCATAILSDKTGTLTRNEMMVRAVWTPGRSYRVTGDGYRPAGEFYPEGSDRPCPAAEDAALVQTLRSGVLCNNAELVPPRQGDRSGVWGIQGDPTEGALLVAAAKAGEAPDRLFLSCRRLGEAPFSPERRRMAVLAAGPGGERVLHAKGAPDTILSLTTRVLDPDGRVRPLTEADRQAALAAAEAMAGAALRVLAVAYRPLGPAEPGQAGDPSPEADGVEALERDLVLTGLVGLMDPPRPEVRQAVRAAARAGIRTVMVTGDHPATALAVARELGIAGPGERALTGAEVEAMADEELVAAAANARVFARVAPQHKLRIVRAFKARGEIVAMTGDGVNDAPAVKEADIGIAMGRGGTDVTREASQLVLADDNYATIVAAVEEGRGIYDNIRKFIRYLLACNTGEVLTMFLAAAARLPLPLLPIQILWVNLVTDGLPAMALGMDPPEPDVMSRPPRRPDEGVFSRGLGGKILGRGLLIGLGTLALFLWGLLGWGLLGGAGALGPGPGPGGLAEGSPALARARTLAFAGLVMAQLFHVFDCRSERRTIWEVGLLTNPWLVAATATSFGMLLAAVYWPPLARVMETFPLSLKDWLAVLAVAGAGQGLVALQRLLLGGRAAAPRGRPVPGR